MNSINIVSGCIDFFHSWILEMGCSEVAYASEGNPVFRGGIGGLNNLGKSA